MYVVDEGYNSDSPGSRDSVGQREDGILQLITIIHHKVLDT